MTLEIVAPGRFKLNGSVTFDTSPEIERDGCTLLSKDETNDWEIDLSNLSQVDSSALSVCLSWARMAQKQKKRLFFTAIPAKLSSLINVCDIESFLDLRRR